jgi:hypothetical protein
MDMDKNPVFGDLVTGCHQLRGFGMQKYSRPMCFVHERGWRVAGCTNHSTPYAPDIVLGRKVPRRDTQYEHNYASTIIIYQSNLDVLNGIAF